MECVALIKKRIGKDFAMTVPITCDVLHVGDLIHNLQNTLCKIDDTTSLSILSIRYIIPCVWIDAKIKRTARKTGKDTLHVQFIVLPPKRRIKFYDHN